MNNLKSVLGVFLLLISTHSNAATIGLGGMGSVALHQLGGPDIYFGDITTGVLNYDLLSESGTGDIQASDGIGDSILHNVVLTGNANGSIHMSGLFDAWGNTNNVVEADIVVDYFYDELFDVTSYNIWTLDSDGDGITGALITSGGFVGLNFDLNASVSMLAYVGNEFPVYSPVPVPAAVWLFGSGLIGLIGIAKRKARA